MNTLVLLMYILYLDLPFFLVCIYWITNFLIYIYIYKHDHNGWMFPSCLVFFYNFIFCWENMQCGSLLIEIFSEIFLPNIFSLKSVFCKLKINHGLLWIIVYKYPSRENNLKTPFNWKQWCVGSKINHGVVGCW